MSRKTILVLVAVFAALFGFLATAAHALAASTEKVLYDFCSISGCADGIQPGGLIFDTSVDLYGSTTGGGAHGYGTVFELRRGEGGAWTESVIYNFCSASNCTDGAYPTGGVIFDATGNLYGMTAEGGAYGSACGGFGCGTVFELTPNGNGAWTETVLHNFNDDGEDGWEPLSSLIFDTAGNLYGTTFGGGASKARACQGRGCGTVFELTPNGSGTWTETVLHSFCPGHGCAGDGSHPLAGLVLDEKGSLYGATSAGGSHQRPCGAEGCGVVFKLSPLSSGKWKEIVLHDFSNRGGSTTGLIFDIAGNLYGTTLGTVFELKKKGGWTEKVLHTFGKGKDGATPSGSLTSDANGNLYGTTFFGGSSNAGTVFRLTPDGNGKWTEKILHSFIKDGKDGTLPGSGVIFDTAGNLYGTTAAGGTSGTGCGGSGCGTVFEITP